MYSNTVPKFYWSILGITYSGLLVKKLETYNILSNCANFRSYFENLYANMACLANIVLKRLTKGFQGSNPTLIFLDIVLDELLYNLTLKFK